ncbi:MAG: TetR/AcrR family transcriptional regulator [Pseudomonadota bacterium]|jgi:TetR/AcrR family transcriptional repressor of nem operon|nr:MAG: TetR/AcrR family transcriptional regulator [Pseudomonadota bacterium]
MAQPTGFHPGFRDTATLIEDATIALVRRQGWAATTVEQICRTAGVTKGAFFHHFGSKEEVGVAAARRWGEVTSALFLSADYRHIEDPLERIHAYLDLRGKLAEGPLEDITCFAGTTIQETFATSDRIRVAAGRTIEGHLELLAEDFRAAIDRYRPREPVTAEDLALYTQTVLQGAFVLAKARSSTQPVHAALVHLKRYLALLFGTPVPEAASHPTEEK